MWDNPDVAQGIMSQRAEVERKINLYETKTKEFENLKELLELANTENDQSLISDTEKQLLCDCC